MYGKATTHLIRLSAITQLINQVIDVLIKFPDESDQFITEKFILLVNGEKTASLKIKHITCESVIHAKNLLDYFNHQKLILRGYNIDSNDDSSNLYEAVESNIFNKREKFDRLLKG